MCSMNNELMSEVEEPRGEAEQHSRGSQGTEEQYRSCACYDAGVDGLMAGLRHDWFRLASHHQHTGRYSGEPGTFVLCSALPSSR
jgi:hypothetical protein